VGDVFWDKIRMRRCVLKMKKKKKKKKTCQTTPCPAPAAPTILTAPPCIVEGEGGHASTDAFPTERAILAPEATEPPSMGGRSEAAEGASATPVAASSTTTPGESSATPATQAGMERANTAERAAPEPRTEGETAGQGPCPSSEPSPPLTEILGRLLRITAHPCPFADEEWERMREALFASFRDGVTRA
jgi:hypothetical protein